VSRGPPPTTAIDDALKVARTRGFVTACKRDRDSVCDFVIHAMAYTAVVTIVRSRRLHGSLVEMERDWAERLARLRLVPPGLCRSLELWACSPRGVLRFFRLSGPGLIELDRNGEPVPGIEKIPAHPGSGE
jgi:hypothetical protein